MFAPIDWIICILISAALVSVRPYEIVKAKSKIGPALEREPDEPNL